MGRRRGARRTGRRTARRTTRRTSRRVHRRRRRRRVLVGGFVLLAVGGAAYGAIKLSQKDSERVEEYTGASVEELSEEELMAAMDELGIQGAELTDEDRAAMSSETDQTTQPAPAAAPATASQDSYLDQLERLGSLRDQGIITEEEFQAKKKEILGL
jgi:hypothetical protein